MHLFEFPHVFPGCRNSDAFLHQNLAQSQAQRYTESISTAGVSPLPASAVSSSGIWRRAAQLLISLEFSSEELDRRPHLRGEVPP